MLTEAILGIKQWGNNLAVRLISAIDREAHLQLNQRVSISAEADRVLIAPIYDAPLTLEQRLAIFDPERHGGEVMTASQTILAQDFGNSAE